jgi:MHS family shikimate/dehydroshikimate transporter-like MFS transporter
LTTETMGKQKALGSTIFASTIGTVVEWYDFILYATAAALIFNHLFFPQFDPTTGIIASFATYTVGFLVRPLGGIVFGWMGDRIGRKPVLMITLLMMGISTTLIGCLPTYDTIGIWAPILLLLLRVVQGLGAGAEYAGAVVMAGEIAGGRRGFFASLPAAAVDVATILAAGIFALFTLLPEDDFMSWGWRIPFLLSGLVLFLGVYIRQKVPESPEFVQVKEERRDAKLPVLEVLRDHPRTMLAAMGANLAPNLSYVFQTFTLAYATSKLGFPREIILTGVMLSSAFGAVMCVVFGALSDRVGRVPIMAMGSAAAAIYSLVYFQLLGAGDAMDGGCADHHWTCDWRTIIVWCSASLLLRYFPHRSALQRDRFCAGSHWCDFCWSTAVGGDSFGELVWFCLACRNHHGTLLPDHDSVGSVRRESTKTRC